APKVTVAPAWKLVPTRVTGVPPSALPTVGLMPLRRSAPGGPLPPPLQATRSRIPAVAAHRDSPDDTRCFIETPWVTARAVRRGEALLTSAGGRWTSRRARFP